MATWVGMKLMAMIDENTKYCSHHYLRPFDDELDTTMYKNSNKIGCAWVLVRFLF
jgi:hypothetical protein